MKKSSKSDRLIRLVDKIEWFGGYNSKRDSYNNFGFLQSDIFVHSSQVQCSEEKISQNVAVTFEIVIGKNGKKEAKNLKLLKEEDSKDIILNCFKSNDSDYWLPVISKYFSFFDK